MTEIRESESALRRALRLARLTVGAWLDDDAIRWSAAIAYYSVVSLAPLVVLTVTVVAQVSERTRAERWVLDRIEATMGPQAAEVAGTVVTQMTALNLASFGAVLTVLLLVFGATAVFANLQRALNRIWAVEPRGGAVRNLARTRLAAFTAVLGLGGVMVLSVVIGAVLGWLGPFVAALDSFLPLVRLADAVSSILVFWLAVSLVYWVLPDVEIAWRDVWSGALATAVLLVLGRLFLSSFLARNVSASMYGTAGSIFLLLLWVYYSALVFFLGAEFTQVRAEDRGREIVPKPYAVRIRTTREVD